MGAEQVFPIISDYVRLQNAPFKKDFTSTMILVYGAFMVLGGMLGFALKGSKISLVAGFVLGVAFMYDSWLLTHASTGRELGMFLSGAVAGVFGYRFFVGGKTMALFIALWAVFIFGLLYEFSFSTTVSAEVAEAKAE